MMKMTLGWISDEKWVEVAQDRFQCRGLVLPAVTWIAALRLPRITSTSHADQCAVVICLGQLFLERDMFDTKVVEKVKTQFLVQYPPPPPHENRTVCEIMWRNIVEWGRPQMTIWRTRIACCIPEATNTHSEYVTLIAFPQQKQFQE